MIQRLNLFFGIICILFQYKKSSDNDKDETEEETDTMDEETDTFDEEMDGSGEETQSIALRYYFSDAGESERSEEDHGSSQFRCVFLDTAFKHKRFSL